MRPQFAACEKVDIASGASELLIGVERLSVLDEGVHMLVEIVKAALAVILQPFTRSNIWSCGPDGPVLFTATIVCTNDVVNFLAVTMRFSAGSTASHDLNVSVRVRQVLLESQRSVVAAVTQGTRIGTVFFVLFPQMSDNLISGLKWLITMSADIWIHARDLMAPLVMRLTRSRGALAMVRENRRRSYWDGYDGRLLSSFGSG